MLRKVQFFGGVLVQRAEDAVMADQSFELAPERLALDVVYHVFLPPFSVSRPVFLRRGV